MRAQPPTPTPVPSPCIRAVLAEADSCRGRGDSFRGDGGALPPHPLELSSPLSAKNGRDDQPLTRRGGQGGEVVRALVLGLGNPLRGDDGIGPAVIAALRPRASRGLTLIESDGHDLVEWLASETFDRIVIVDAADLGQRAGTWRRVAPQDLAAGPADFVTHALGLVQALELLATLGAGPRAPITIYAVQPAHVGWRPGLSREARRAVLEVAGAIRQELRSPQSPRRGGTVLRTEQDVRSLPCTGGTA